MRGILIILAAYLAMLVIVGPARDAQGILLGPNAGSLLQFKQAHAARAQQTVSLAHGLQTALQRDLDLLPVSRMSGSMNSDQLVRLLGPGPLLALGRSLLPLAALSVLGRLLRFAIVRAF